MGGRGASGTGGTVGAEITSNGTTTKYYFSRHNGTNYYSRGIGATPQPTPNNMSASEFMRRAKSSGATVRTISISEKRKDERKREADRKATDKALNKAYVTDKHFVKGSRSNRISNRASKRAR